MSIRREWTLSEAARLLRQPQHRLIYLCEKRAVVPDLGDASGRGSSRRFSARNLLEFAVALQLRGLALPVDAVRAILYALRSFEATVGQEVRGFNLVDDLSRADAPVLRALVAEGPRIYFSLGAPGKKPRFFGGVDLPARASKRRPRIRELDSQAVQPEVRAKVEVNVTDIAKGLDLEE